MLLTVFVAIGQDKKIPDFKSLKKTEVERQGKTFVSILINELLELAFENSKPGSQGALLKSALDTKQQLDSIISYHWDETNAMEVVDGKEEFHYNDNGDRYIYKFSEWDADNQQWAKSWIYNFFYDESGNLEMEVKWDWSNDSNKWVYAWKELYWYDNSGRVSVKNAEEWDAEYNDWRRLWSQQYKYNDLGQIAIYYYFGFSSSSNRTKTEFEYDDEGLLVVQKHYSWNDDGNQWQLGSKTEHDYDSSGNELSNTYYVWDTVKEKWEMWGRRWQYDYDGYRNLIRETVSEWSSIDGQFINLTKHEYSYNEYGNKISAAFYWSVEGRWDNFTFKKKYYYSDIETTGIKQSKSPVVRVYPNPVSEYLNFELPATFTKAVFELFDLQGRKLITKEISNSERISLESLISGIYVYTIDVDGHNQSGKLVKK
jgi:hypothetical protein